MKVISYCEMFYPHVKLCFTVSILFIYGEKARGEKKGLAQIGNTDEVRIFYGLIGVSLALSAFLYRSRVLKIRFCMEGKGEAWNA